MKKYILWLLLLQGAASAQSQSSNDSLAIMQVLYEEGATWRKGDIKGHAATWAKRPYNFVTISTPTGEVRDVDPAFILNPPASATGGGGFAFHSNHLFSIRGASAWVKHDEVSVNKEGVRTYSKEVRILEKEGSDWKLVGQTGFFYIPKKSGNTSDTVSHVQMVDITTGEVETVASLQGHFEAPNWHPSGYLLLNSYGKLIRLDLKSGSMTPINTGAAQMLNNDHGISPDKKMLVVSNFDELNMAARTYKSYIYVLPIEGGAARKVTPNTPSFWHGWSPDGKTLAYCAERNGNFDVYTIPVEGGREKRLTSTEGLDDGPEYSPDGKYIYMNSYRTGHMQIWRMKADGSDPEQLTFDENSNWFAHPSPDGKWIVYISYLSDEKQNHLFGKQVQLKLMDLETKKTRDITPVFFGGQGTINVPSWSPDSKMVAFVSYSIK